MGRKRRRVIRVVKRVLPKVFSCPKCGVSAVRIIPTPDNGIQIACGNCHLTYTRESTKKEAIDVYNEFVDQFMAGKIAA